MSIPVNVNASRQYGASKFTVSSTPGRGAYDSITDAVTACSLAGGGSVYVLAGIYVEDISFPQNISVIGVNTGLQTSVIINGTHTFSQTGNISFENLFFTYPSTVFSVGNAGSNNSSAEFNNCQIQSIGSDPAFVIYSIAGTGNVIFSESYVSCLGGYALSVSNGTAKSINNSEFASFSADAVVLNVDGTLEISNCEVDASLGNGIVLNDVTSSLVSQNNLYTCANSAFNYLSAGTASSVYDTINANGINFADGLSGTFSYSLPTLTGSSSTIAVGLTQIKYASILPPIPPLTWNQITSNAGIVPGNGYVVTSGAVVLTLPATSAFGDTFCVLLDGGTSWQIAQNAGQSTRIGSQISSTGISGSISSSDQGDAVYFVCTSANTKWTVFSGTQGNILIT